MCSTKATSFSNVKKETTKARIELKITIMLASLSIKAHKFIAVNTNNRLKAPMPYEPM